MIIYKDNELLEIVLVKATSILNKKGIKVALTINDIKDIFKSYSESILKGMLLEQTIMLRHLGKFKYITKKASNSKRRKELHDLGYKGKAIAVIMHNEKKLKNLQEKKDRMLKRNTGRPIIPVINII